jgi:hypothetical protein
MNILDVLQRAQEVCASCGIRKVDLLLCPCRQVHYCSTPCQVQHWKVHRIVCSKGVTSHGTRPPVKHCYYCGRGSYHIRGCQCGLAFYCDAQCQGKHWGQHRRTCSTWDVDAADAATTARSDPRIMRIRRMDAEVQTDAETAVGPSLVVSDYMTMQRPHVHVGNGNHGGGALHGTPSDGSAFPLHGSMTIGPGAEEGTDALHGVSGVMDGFYHSMIAPSSYSSGHHIAVQNPNAEASMLQGRHAPQEQLEDQFPAQVDGVPKALLVPPSPHLGFEFSGLLPTGGGDLSIRTATSDGGATAAARSRGSDSGVVGRHSNVTSKVLAAHRVEREKIAAVDGSHQPFAKMSLPPVNPLDIDAINAQRSDLLAPMSSSSGHRGGSQVAGQPRRRESDSIVELQPSASFLHTAPVASPSNLLTRKGTVMSNVLSGAAAHLSRSRSGASGLFSQSSARFLPVQQDPLQQEWNDALVEFTMDEEEERLDIANARAAELSTMETVVKRFLFIESAKVVGVEEEAARLELLTQYNLWLRTTAVVAFRRLRKP